jgi:hypothetical protein
MPMVLSGCQISFLEKERQRENPVLRMIGWDAWMYGSMGAMDGCNACGMIWSWFVFHCTVVCRDRSLSNIILQKNYNWLYKHYLFVYIHLFRHSFHNNILVHDKRFTKCKS